MAAMALEDCDFDIDAYVNSEMGEGVMELLANVILYQEMDDEVIEYWTNLGIQKDLYNEEDDESKFAVYTPVEILNDDSGSKWPVVFCLHGGGNPIYAAEAYRFAQLGATENYITVMPEDCSIEGIEEVLDFLKENYPVDETRVYSTGLSAGGNKSYELASSVPELFAAVTPCGQPVLFNGSASVEDVSAIGGVAIYNLVGQYDAFSHYPFTVSGWLTSEEKIEGFNKWLEANNLVYEEELTAEKIESLYGNSDDVVISNTGVDFPTTYTIEADGTEFWTGEYENQDGVNTLRVSLVKGGIHWVTASYAELSWNYMKNFSRDPETKQLVYSGE
ncbi:MAG: hypothetical protein LUD18_15180 [Lachnospiraceae bacterium]|nr:hypothetical protein [Lachnospiraceae bacterium]